MACDGCGLVLTGCEGMKEPPCDKLRVKEKPKGEYIMKTKYKHIHFTKILTGWVCHNNKTDDNLGRITFYRPWNRFVFEGITGCVFDEKCLADIIDFLQALKGG